MAIIKIKKEAGFSGQTPTKFSAAISGFMLYAERVFPLYLARPDKATRTGRLRTLPFAPPRKHSSQDNAHSTGRATVSAQTI